MRTIRRGSNTYEVYTKDEADEANIKYVYWKEATEKGQYVLLDDDKVVEVRGLSYAKSGKKHIYTAIAAGWDDIKQLVEGYGIRTWQEKEAGRKRTKDVVDLYSLMLLSGKVDWSILGQAYRPDQQIPEATVRRLFKQEKIKKMVEKKLIEILSDYGITDDFIATTLKTAIEIGEEKNDVANLLKAVDMMLEMRGHKGNTEKVTETLQIDSSLVNLIEGAEQEERERLTAKRETVTPSK